MNCQMIFPILNDVWNVVKMVFFKKNQFLHKMFLTKWSICIAHNPCKKCL